MKTTTAAAPDLAPKFFVLTLAAFAALGLWLGPPAPRACATPPLVITPDHFLCQDWAPRFDCCTNPVHPHFWLRLNTGTTNGGNNPGGHVGVGRLSR